MSSSHLMWVCVIVICLLQVSATVQQLGQELHSATTWRVLACIFISARAHMYGTAGLYQVVHSMLQVCRTGCPVVPSVRG